MTPILAVSPDAPDPDAIGWAAEILRGGGLVAFATETVYGLGADATSDAAVARIFAAKGRPATNPLIVHVDSIESARPVAGGWSDRAETLALRFWPGPLSLVVPRGPMISDLATAGGPTMAIRVPRPKVARELLARAGVPIAAPSANRSCRISPTMARHVVRDLDGRLDLILDSGPAAVGLESTVLDLTADPPIILRPGAITPDDLAPLLGLKPGFRATTAGEPARSPGLAEVHYAPTTPSFRVDLGRLGTVVDPGRAGLLIVGHPSPRSAMAFAHRVELLTPDFAAPAFYDALHRLDEFRFAALYVVPPPDLPPWFALRDRIARATRPVTDPAR